MGNCNSIPQPAEDTALAALNSFINSVSKKVHYKRDLKKNIVLLEDESKKLNEVNRDVLQRVKNEETQPRRKRLSQVQGWLTRVEDAKTKVDEQIKDGPDEVNRLCLGGLCYKNYKFASSSFGTGVAKNLKRVESLKTKGEHFKVQEVTGRTPDDAADGWKYFTPPVGLESTFDEVWRCYEEYEEKIIGLYGMGGAGKTVLLCQINNKIRETSADIILIFISATNKNLENIQDGIGVSLNLNDESWKNKSFSEKANDIRSILKRKKFVLLLDDVWEWVDLIEAGVPDLYENGVSKVVFTTRLPLDVCFRNMKAQMVKVECLEHKYALQLFRSTVGDKALDNHPEIPVLAETMAKQCGGLPLALIKVAEDMRYKKAPQEWEYVINEFRRWGHKYSGMQDVYQVLRSSYDNLPKDPIIKSCFLYCGLFPKSHTISGRDLIDCWIGQGFLDDEHVAENKGYWVIGALVHAGLLEEDHDRVKIHGITRDLALWIIKNDRRKEKVFVDTGAGLSEAPRAGEWEGVRWMSAMQNQIEILPEAPPGHCLETLFLNDNHLKVINGGFFKFMSCLTVLNLSNNPSLTELPLEISKLGSLQHLDLSGTGVKELPEGLKALSNLRYLNLRNTSELQTIPQTLLSNFPKLETLRMLKCGALDQDGELLIEQLLRLGRLHSLDISINGSPALERLLSSRSLVSCLESLSLQNLTHTRSIPLLLADLKKLQRLDISDCQILEELHIKCEDEVENAEICNFRSLREVNIKSCPNLKHLSWLILATSLRRIVISDCSDMDELISVGRLGEFPESVRGRIPFEKLESIVLRGLPNLQRINETALRFSNLKEIEVIGCPQLKKLPLDSESAKEGRIVIKGEQQWWDGLQWEDPAIRCTFDPCFKPCW